jgi:hypothetical protein
MANGKCQMTDGKYSASLTAMELALVVESVSDGYFALQETLVSYRRS